MIVDKEEKWEKFIAQSNFIRGDILLHVRILEYETGKQYECESDMSQKPHYPI